MKHLSTILATAISMMSITTACRNAAQPQQTPYPVESFAAGRHATVDIHCVRHGSVVIDVTDKKAKQTLRIAVDPVQNFYGQSVDYSCFGGADAVLLTHEHGDHLDAGAIETLGTAPESIFGNAVCIEALGKGQVLANGDATSLACGNITVGIKAVAAYNTSEGHLQFHPQGNGNGYLIDVDGFVVYVAGDTEPIEEMASLGQVDVALLPCNQPYTMTAEQCIEAARVVKPRVLIPYHLSDTDLTPVLQALEGSGIEVRTHEELR